MEDDPEGNKAAVEKEVSGGLMAGREAAAAAETGSEQMTGKDTQQTDEMAKLMDKDEKVEGTGSVAKKPRSTPFITRPKDERRWARIKEQE